MPRTPIWDAVTGLTALAALPSRLPRRVFETRPVKWLLEQGCIVICAGGGGIPTIYRPGTRTLVGVEAVIDKDPDYWADQTMGDLLDKLSGKKPS